jgi:hypothetical protein
MPHLINMHSGKKTMRLRVAVKILLLIFLAGCSAAHSGIVKAVVSPEPKNYAWWLRTEFIPVHREIRGIPVQQLDPSWRLASELSKEAIPKELLYQGGTDAMEASRLSFSRSGDFNHDGIEDLALIGVYQDKEEKRGSFILILAKDKAGRNQKSFLQHLGRPAFAALSGKEPMEVWFCMDCNYGVNLLWDGENGEYRMNSFQSEEDD